MTRDLSHESYERRTALIANSYIPWSVEFHQYVNTICMSINKLFKVTISQVYDWSTTAELHERNGGKQENENGSHDEKDFFRQYGGSNTAR